MLDSRSHGVIHIYQTEFELDNTDYAVYNLEVSPTAFSGCRVLSRPKLFSFT